MLPAEVFETGSALGVQFEAPEVMCGDFQMSVNQQLLSNQGKLDSSAERNEGTYQLTKRAYGSFERVITLPCRVDDAKAMAQYRDGVLHIALPKKSNGQLKRILVNWP